MPRTRPEIHVPANSDWIEALDRARGKETRAAFVRRLLQRSLARRGYKLTRIDDRRGQYCREAAGLLSPRTLAQRRRRAKQREYTARWRRRQPTLAERQAAARAALLAGFTFCDDGLVHHVDLTGQGHAAAFIDATGQFMGESRFTRWDVYEALMRAVASEPRRAWPERYQRFLDHMRLTHCPPGRHG